MRGQISEIMGFVILAVAIIVIISLSMTYFSSGFVDAFKSLTERHESEGFKAGVTSVMHTTEPKTGKKLLELLGVATFAARDTLDFGPVIGKVNVTKEIGWRFDQLYKPGHWFMKVPFPDVLPRLQVVIIVDTSASLCDDVEDMRENLPRIIEELRDEGINIAATIFMLPGGGRCCGNGGGSSYKLQCSGLFKEKPYFHCVDITGSRWWGGENEEGTCTTAPKNEEDWGRGLKCAIEAGPVEEWNEFSAKIGIILSDELSGSSDGCQPGGKQQSLDIGIDAAKEFGMYVFPLKANPCGCVCTVEYRQVWHLCTYETCAGNCPSYCCEYIVDPQHRICKCSSQLDIDMGRLANETGGQMFELVSGDETSNAIREIFTNFTFPINPYFELGTPPPEGKNIRAVTIPLPVNFIGEYTNAHFYQWS